MAVQTYDSRQSFLEATQRYKERNPVLRDTDNTRVPEPAPQPDNSRNTGSDKIPIPVPIKFETNNVISSQLYDVKTLLDSIRDDLETNSLIDQYTIMNNLAATNNSISGEQKTILEEIRDGWSKGLEKYSKDISEDQGWATRLFDGLFGLSKKEPFTIIDGINKTVEPIVKGSKESVKFLQEIYKLQAKANSVDAAETKKLFDEDRKPKLGAFGGFADLFFPDDGALAKITDGFKGFFNFLKGIGDKATEASKTDALTGLVENLSGSKGFVGKLVKNVLSVVRWLGGLGSIFAAVASISVIASTYAFFKHPEQLGKLFLVLGRLFDEVIMPAFIWIQKNVIPLLVAGFAAVVFVLEKFLDEWGTIINGVLIDYVLPGLIEILKSLGKTFLFLLNMITDYVKVIWAIVGPTIKFIWNGIARLIKAITNIGELIAGFFGYGPKAGISFVDAFTGIITEFFSYFWDLIKMAATAIKEIFTNLWNGPLGEKIKFFGSAIWGLIKWIGGKIWDGITWIFNNFWEVLKGAGGFIWGAIKGVGSFIGDIFTRFLNWIKDAFLSLISDDGPLASWNPGKILLNAIYSFFNWIVGLIPSWKTIKSFILSMLPNWVPNFIRNWFTDTGDGPNTGTPPDNEIEAANQIHDSNVQAVSRNNDTANQNPAIQPVMRNTTRVQNSLNKAGDNVIVQNTVNNVTNNTSASTQSGGSSLLQPTPSISSHPLDNVLYGD